MLVTLLAIKGLKFIRIFLLMVFLFFCYRYFTNINRLQYPSEVMQHTLTFQKSFDNAFHGKNCSDTLCVLPQCVNFKLQTRHTNTLQKDKQRNCTGRDMAPSDVAVNIRKNNDRDKLMSLNQAILDHDAEKQLLDDIQEFERILEGQMADFGPHPGFNRDFYKIDQQNSSPSYTAREDCQVSTQTHPLPSYSSKDDVQFLRQIPAEEARKHQREPPEYDTLFDRGGATFKEPSNPKMIHSTESNQDPIFLNYYEQFTSTDESAHRPMKESQGRSTAKRTRTDPETITLPVSTTNVEKTACHILGTTEQLTCMQRKPSQSVFGILSQILHMFEKPRSAEVEAIFVHVLQKALRDIQSAVKRDSIKFVYFRPGTSL